MAKSTAVTSVAPQSRPATVVIAHVTPAVEGGRYPAKRIVGERIRVEADLFKDGHDVIAAVVKWRKRTGRTWEETPMVPGDNDRWWAEFPVPEPGEYRFTVEAWADDFLTWLHDYERRLTGDQSDFSTEIEEGRVILNLAADRAARGRSRADAEEIDALVAELMKTPAREVPHLVGTDRVHTLLARWPNRSLSTQLDPALPLLVEAPLAQFSAWYEFFPRSAEGREDKHSTFRDCLPRLRDARDMGFDIVYFPPIHPIGITFRKGKNNTLTAGPDDVGSPWAIGGPAGGHRDVEPALGTVADLEWLVGEARALGIEIALDFAINCSPDHPYVREHPDWFFHRPDGTIKYAENPPKKYQDIYPINFHCDEWRELWQELLDVVLFWIDRGVKVFRVDNPHTKPVAFWEWLIAEVRKTAPDTIFLSEAFTRPKMMQTLAKIGYTQSYTYFTWRVTKAEIIEYVRELTRGEMRDYYRANFWPNTPDILPHHLQHAPPATFKLRAALAATLSTSWGIYSGYELCENDPLPGREEYNHSEKYQLKARDWDAPGNIKDFIRRLNCIRRQQPALQSYANIDFIPCENDQILAYYKWTDDRSNIVIGVVNLDPHHRQETVLHLPLEAMGIGHDRRFAVEDLMYEEIYHWQGASNYVALEPRSKPVHLFLLHRETV
ncbi:MAG: alpha-1,4-glucan--maltose-1-phosphate maltosyltransferase [Verrucomicrobiales bacterium]|nr:alpha-1,4-glucan--maltose-1-phosphate maltosyltransferase [Verrucomicrobiales bacterium]